MVDDGPQGAQLQFCRRSFEEAWNTRSKGQFDALLTMLFGASGADAPRQQMHRCCCCGSRRPHAHFSRDRSRANGLSPRCKDCQQLYRQGRAASIRKTAIYLLLRDCKGMKEKDLPVTLIQAKIAQLRLIAQTKIEPEIRRMEIEERQ